MKKIFVLAMLLCLFALPVQAEIRVETHTMLPTVELPDNDELLAAYVEQQLYAELYGGISTFGMGRYSAGSRLSGDAAYLYNILAEEIQVIAANGSSDTIFSFGTTINTVDGKLVPDFEHTFTGTDRTFITAAVDALIADFPYDMYWFDKGTNGWIWTVYSDDTRIYAVEIKFSVAPAYQNGAQYTVKPASQGVKDAVANAKAVVAANADKSDLEKLQAYKAYICGQVTYHDDAASPGYTGGYGDPWQLIYVFDENADTNVVCEGYSKAFQYLCDLSVFDDVECYTVSGTMTGGTGSGAHMWNIVRMGGKSYLVDVTNSDAGTVGSNGSLFMAKAASGSVDEGYQVLGVNNTPVLFVYDADQIALWGNTVLELALPEVKKKVASVTSGSVTTYYETLDAALADWTDGTTLTLLDNVSCSNGIVIYSGETRTLVGGSCELDLGGYQLDNNGTLTIDGGSIVTNREGEATISNSGRLIILGATITNVGEDYAVINYGELTVTGGRLTGVVGGLDNERDASAELNGITLTTIMNYGEATITDCTFIGDAPQVDFRGGKLIFTDDSCAGWVIANYGGNDGAVGEGKDIDLPDDYYLFDDDGKIVTILGNYERGIIGKHTADDHEAAFEADEDTDTITASCAACGEPMGEATLKAPADLTYDGMQKSAVITNSTGVIESVRYVKDGEEVIPENAGEYTAILVVGNLGVSVEFTIARAVPVVIAPEAVSGLIYTGDAQQLVIPGSTSGGTMLYSLDGQTWSEEIPSAADVGEYIVYYKVDGDANYESVAAQTLTVSIGKAMAGLTAAPIANSRIYDGTEQPLVTAGSVVAGKMVYSTEETGEYTENIPTAINAGNYTVWFYVQGGNNFTDSEKAAVQVVIDPIVLTVDANDAAYAKTYDGTTSAETAVWKQMPFLNGEWLPGAAIRLTLDDCPDYPNHAAGSYDVEIGCELMGDDAPNYMLNTDKVTVKAIIEPKPLTAASQEYTRAYNAGALLEAVPLMLSGVIDGDTVSATADFQLIKLEVGEHTEASLWDMPVLTGEDAGNYAIEPQDVTFTKATITKAPADLWSIDAPSSQDILVGSGIASISFPASGKGIGNEEVAISSVSYFTDAAMQTAAADADVGALAEGESITLYYAAYADNYEHRTGSMVLNAVKHQHVWSYAVDTQSNAIVATCSGAIGDCPTGIVTFKLVLPANAAYNSGVPERSASYEADPAYATGTEEPTFAYEALPGNAKLDSNGIPHNAGDYKVTMTLGGVSVSDTMSIAPVMISRPSSREESGVYTGKTHDPVLSISSCARDKDYTVTYPADMTNVGTKTITITGVGNYDGSYTLDYEITPKEITNPTIVLETTSCVYDGTEKKPAVTSVKDGEDLIDASEYTVFYSNNVNVGTTATVTIVDAEGGNYTISGSTAFAITQAETFMTAETDKSTYTYGDVITITGIAAAPKAQTFSLMRFAQPAARQVALYDAAGNQLTDGADVVDGKYAITYDTKNKALAPAEDLVLMVKFVGDENMSDQVAMTNGFALKARSVTPAIGGSVTKTYDGTTAVPAGHSLTITLTGVLESDDIGVSGSFVYEDASVGEGKTIRAGGMTLNGSDAEFYALSADTASYAGGTITKARLNGMAIPLDQTLDVYCADAAAVSVKLPQTTIYIVEGGGAVEMRISWSCDSYNNTPNAENTFAWTVNDAEKLACYEPNAGVATSGTITVTNTDALPVVLTGTDKSITYDGNAFDVSAMFTIDENAGAAAYELVPGGDGEGTLSGCMLTIAKAGSFNVRLTTAASGAYAASEAMAVLNVQKGIPAVTAPTGLTAYYSQTLSQIALPADAHGVWSWADGDTLVGDAGQRVHKAIFTPNDTNLWNTAYVDVTIDVAQAGTVFVGDVGVYNGETATKDFTYGDTITVKVKPEMTQPAVFGLRFLIAPKKDQMALYIGDAQITAPADAVDGVYTMIYETSGKALPVGETAITAKYVGNDNLLGYEQSVDITLNPKQLTIASVSAKDRIYNSDMFTVQITGAAFVGKVLDTDDVTLAANTLGTLASDAVGTYTEVELPSELLLAGEHASYYTVVGGAKVPTSVQITEVPEDLLVYAEINENFSDADIPAELKAKFDTVAKIEIELRAQLAKQDSGVQGTELYDVVLMYSEDGGQTWIKADLEHFPKNGRLPVMLPIPKGTDPDRHDYIVTHMFTSSAFGKTPGDTEMPSVSIAYNEQGVPMIYVEVTGLSPIMVGWTEKEIVIDLPETGDNSRLALWLMLMGMAGAAMLLLRRRVRN